MAEKMATREAYGKALAEFGETYDFVVLDAVLAEATKTGIFKKAFPSRFFDCGIAEGNMMSVAAGIASTGKTVFASSFAMFAAGRAFEQVRNSIGYPHLNVKIGATHAGISVGEDGATHQCLEDIALMRSIPGVNVLNPADATEARAVVKAALDHKGPGYMRFGRLAVETIFDKDTFTFEIGKGQLLADGTDVTIVSTGLCTSMAIAAVELLKNEGVSARLVNMASIKPIDRDLLIDSAKKTGCVLTVEEHNVIGGLGSAVAEVVVESGKGCAFKQLGIQDKFAPIGLHEDIMSMLGIDSNGIVNVTATDKGTGKEQKIRIEASSGLTEQEIQRMRDEAKANEAKDKEEKERIDKINAADSNIFATEKQLKEYGDKLPADKKSAIEGALAKLKEAHKNADVAAIDTAIAELNAAWQAASQDIYAQQQAQGAQPGADAGQSQSQANAGGASNGGDSSQPEDVEFEEVK